MHIIRARDYTVVPWKNGGGTATNIVASPPDAGFDAFDWRLSGAHVGRDGPFSVFPDIDRTMVILSSGSLALHGLDAEPVVLTQDSAPFDFAGDVLVSATLGAGPVDNLNVMIDRRRFQRTVRRSALTQSETIKPRGTLLVYAWRGSVGAVGLTGNLTLANEDTLVSTDKTILTGGPGSCAIIIEIWPK
jgi:uncharacterized protein